MSYRPSKDKEITEIVRTIEQQGWVCTQTGGNHVKARAPNGALVFMSHTPNASKHTILNIKRDLRRAGANI